MENATQALQMAFSVLVFVVALSISIAMFGRANTALTNIINYNNNRTLYTYVESSSANRTVGVETIVPAMYRAYKENYRIVFYNKDGTVNYIDLEEEVWGDAQKASLHLDEILGNGLYNDLSKLKFTEEIGEYYMEDKNDPDNDTITANKTKKRVITYTVQ
jgi:uncharacterized protein (UPF0333 family)